MFSARGGFLFAGNPPAPAPAAGDPYWNDVYVYMDGESVSDNSIFAHAVTNSGVTVSNTQVKYGTSSLYFDGSSYLYLSGSDLGVGTGDFTIDLWAYHTSFADNRVYVETRTDGSTTGAMIFFADSGGGITDYVDTGYYTFYQDGTLSLNTWHHIALSRQGTTSRLFIDGVLIDSATDTVDYSKDGFILGAVIGGGAALMQGYFDNVRLTKGVARYTASFTPPTSSDYGPPPDPYWNNVQLLMNFDNNLTDQSGLTSITNYSTTYETTQKKFGSASLFCNSGLGGSSGLGFSNGSLDPGTGDFCVEVHHYSPGAATNYYTGFSFNNSATGDFFGMLCLGNASSWNAHFFDGTTMFANSTNLNLNQWYHIAIIRESGNMYIAVDGVRQYVGTNTEDITLSSPNLCLPTGYGGDCGLGYWDNLRVTIGNARYTSDFTPPTAFYPNY